MPPDSELDKMCNRSVGGVIDITCKDDKGEAFRSFNGSKMSGDNNFQFTCSFEKGATCQTMHPNATCADYAIQIRCTCPPQRTRKYGYLYSTKSKILAYYMAKEELERERLCVCSIKHLIKNNVLFIK